MAVNSSRSMNAELYEGRTDGILNKVVRDRGGEVDAATRLARSTLFPEYSGFIADDPPRYFTGEEAIPR